MASIFVARGTASAIPIWFVTAQTYPDVRKHIGTEASAFADAAAFEPKSGQHLLLPGKAGLGGILFGLEGPNDIKDPFLPGGCRTSCPMAPTVLPTSRMTRALRRLLLLSAFTASRATARLKRET
jgi:hypothetical protein